MKKILNIKNILLSSIVSIIMVIFSSCTKDAVVEPSLFPDTILLNEKALYPEGIIYSRKQQKIYVGSYFKGKIVTVDASGNILDFVVDKDLVSVVGLAINETNNWLIVCNSDGGLAMNSHPLTVGKLAQVIVYDLSSGAKIRSTDLSGLYLGGHFANDVTTDDNGNIYVTDSFSPIVYKIDSDGKASILANDNLFMPPPGAFGLNGIVYHPDNYLIVGTAYNGKLYKIPLDNQQDINEISINTPVNSLDGLLLTDNNTLVLVSNNFTGAPFKEAVYQLKTIDSWTTARVDNVFENLAGIFPTTVTTIGKNIYVSNAYFPVLASDSDPIETFEIQKVEFSK